MSIDQSRGHAPHIVSREEWLAARIALLAAEKELTAESEEAEAAGRQQEALEIILGVWGQPNYSYRGKYFQFDPVTAVPTCYQKPCPPTWIDGRFCRYTRTPGTTASFGRSS
jgi:alkanesulfonate monooxygenase SsuD/methylene tetrahydromethanopterin reductase-like flavin-dependent oxidoreductase (luciferase family)